MYRLFNCRGKTITDYKNEIQRNSHVIESVMEKSVQLKDLPLFQMLATVYQGTNLFALQPERIELIERSDSKSSGSLPWLKNYSASKITLLQPCKSPRQKGTGS